MINCSLYTEETAAQPSVAKFSQLYINALENQPAKIVLGGATESYSMGVDKEGFSISRFETEVRLVRGKQRGNCFADDVTRDYDSRI